MSWFSSVRISIGDCIPYTLIRLLLSLNANSLISSTTENGDVSSAYRLMPAYKLQGKSLI